MTYAAGYAIKNGPETLLQQRPALTTSDHGRIEMAKRYLPDAEYLRNILDYNPASGVLTWKVRPPEYFAARSRSATWNTRFAGKPALSSLAAVGYLHGSINARREYAHRIIWKMVYDVDPDEIDHINRDKTDNRLCNLRNVSSAENSQNLPLCKKSTSGTPGVVFQYNGWVVRIMAGGVNLYLGRYKDMNEAISVRKAAERQYGFHPNHGRQMT